MNPYRPRGRQNQHQSRGQVRPPKYTCRICVDRFYFGTLSELKTHLKEHGIQQLPNEQISLYELNGSSVDSLGVGVPTSGGVENHPMHDFQQENRSVHGFQQDYRIRGRSSQRARGNSNARRNQRIRNATPYARSNSMDFDGHKMMDLITVAVSDGKISVIWMFVLCILLNVSSLLFIYRDSEWYSFGVIRETKHPVR